jgi:hypothetical protein
MNGVDFIAKYRRQIEIRRHIHTTAHRTRLSPMPLLKLWNSIRGRSTKQQVAEEHPAAEPQAAPEAARRSGFSIFGGGPHAGLCKLVKSVPASTVLEISVDDGSRAIAVMQTMAKTQHAVRYFAIDQFEMADGGITLKQFHQTLRAENIRPKLFPGSMDRGLLRVAHTIGAVDLVLIAVPRQVWQSEQVLHLLSRVSHAGTVILYRDGETWNRSQSVVSNLQRAA